MAEGKPHLSPGVAFHLSPQGKWEAVELPEDAVKEGEFSGFLTIEGYRCSVFETPDGQQWAQKSVNTPTTAFSASCRPPTSRRTSMTPSQAADRLRRIAVAIEASKNPDKELVVKDLKKVLAAISPPAPQRPQR